MSLLFVMMAAGACLAERAYAAVSEKEEQKVRAAVNIYRREGVSPLALSKTDIMRDWRRERRLFPAPVAAYLEKNPRALDEYAETICRDTVMSTGPALPGRTHVQALPVPSGGAAEKGDYMFMYKPGFIGFLKRYLKKIRVYNNTGVLYY